MTRGSKHYPRNREIHWTLDPSHRAKRHSDLSSPRPYCPQQDWLHLPLYLWPPLPSTECANTTATCPAPRPSLRLLRTCISSMTVNATRCPSITPAGVSLSIITYRCKHFIYHPTTCSPIHPSASTISLAICVNHLISASILSTV